jgi:hypothetical protein
MVAILVPQVIMVLGGSNALTAYSFNGSIEFWKFSMEMV